MNTIPTARSNPVAFGGLLSAGWLSRLRAGRRYDAATRVLGSAWFLLLALVIAQNGSTHAKTISLASFDLTAWSILLSNGCLFLFYLMLGWMVLHRQSPTARFDGFWPSCVAFVGSYLPWTIVLFAPEEAGAGQTVTSTAFLLLGTLLMVVVICHLGRSFSIVPQARCLVRTGPYAFVRNPLYLVEEIALLGTLLRFYCLPTLALFLVHGAIQVRRIIYEETLLRRSFTEYDEYARVTSRLIPFVW